MSIDKPLVSVLLPVYNRPNVVHTINSILSQTFEDFELLIVDNASTDNTVEEIRKIYDSRIRLVINDINRGQTYSLNRGLELAKGKYIARIDSDDIALPTRLEKQVKFLEANTDFGLCGCWVTYVNDNNEKTITMKMPTSDNGMRTMQNFTCSMYHPASMFRRSILDEHNIKYADNIKMAEDYYLWGKIMEHSKALNLPEVLLYYHRGSGNDSQIHRDTMIKESFMVREDICKKQLLDSKELKKMLDVITIEKKNKISLFQTISLYFFYMKYLKSHIKKTDEDFSIIKKYIYMRIYTSCVATNTAFFAVFVRKIYQILLAKKYKKGIKINK